MYLSLRVRDLLLFVLAVLLAGADVVLLELLLRAVVFLEVDLGAAVFLPAAAFLVFFAAETPFLPVVLLFAAGFFLGLVLLFVDFFV